MWHKSGDIEQAGLVAAVEQAAAGIVITDVHGTIQYANPAFTALTGYSCAEAVGQNPRFLKSGETPAALYEELWSTIRSGRVWHGELMNRRKNGTMYCEEMQITPCLLYTSCHLAKRAIVVSHADGEQIGASL